MSDNLPGSNDGEDEYWAKHRGADPMFRARDMNATYCIGCANDWDRSADGSSHDSGSSIVSCTAWPVEVRPLEWEAVLQDRGDGSDEITGWEADSGFNMAYTVESSLDGFCAAFDYVVIGQFESPDDAKACAQSHYDRKIGAALKRSAAPTPSLAPQQRMIGEDDE